MFEKEPFRGIIIQSLGKTAFLMSQTMHYPKLFQALRDAIIANDSLKFRDLLRAADDLAVLTDDSEELLDFLNAPNANQGSLLEIILQQPHAAKEWLESLLTYGVDLVTPDFSAFFLCAFQNPNKELFQFLLPHLTPYNLQTVDHKKIYGLIKNLFASDPLKLLEDLYQNDIFIRRQEIRNFWLAITFKLNQMQTVTELVATYDLAQISHFWLTYSSFLDAMLKSKHYRLFLDKGFFESPNIIARALVNLMDDTYFIACDIREFMITQLISQAKVQNLWSSFDVGIQFPSPIEIDLDDKITQGSLLEFAVAKNRLDIVSAMLENNLNNNGKALYIACVLNLSEMVDLLLMHKVPATLLVWNRTALHHACVLGRQKIIQLFAKHQANLNIIAPVFGTPLMDSISTKVPGIPLLLLELGADASIVHQVTPQKKLFAPFLAIFADNDQVLAYLLKNKKFDPKQSVNNVNALFLAAESGNPEIGKLLLDAGVDANARLVPQGYTPLMLAARYGYTRFVKLLLQHSADPELVLEGNQYTALVFAIVSHSAGCVEMLLAYKAKLPETVANSRIPLIRFIDSVAKGNVTVLNAFLHGGLKVPDNNDKMQEFIKVNKLTDQAVIERLTNEALFKSVIVSPNKAFKKASVFSRTSVVHLEGLNLDFFLSELTHCFTRFRQPQLNAYLAESWIKFVVAMNRWEIELFKILFESIYARRSPYALLIASQITLTEKPGVHDEFIQQASRFLLEIFDNNLNEKLPDIFSLIQNSNEPRYILAKAKIAFLQFSQKTPNWIETLAKSSEFLEMKKGLTNDSLILFMQFVCTCYIHQSTGYVLLPDELVIWDSKIEACCEKGVKKIIEISENQVTQDFADTIILNLRKQTDPNFVDINQIALRN